MGIPLPIYRMGANGRPAHFIPGAKRAGHEREQRGKALNARRATSTALDATVEFRFNERRPAPCWWIPTARDEPDANKETPGPTIATLERAVPLTTG